MVAVFPVVFIVVEGPVDEAAEVVTVVVDEEVVLKVVVVVILVVNIVDLRINLRMPYPKYF